MQRRATILIFTLGVLVLLMLIGVGLLASTRGESRRVEMEREAVGLPATMDNVIRLVQERLRADLIDDSETGACVDQSSSSCVDGITKADCLALPNHFFHRGQPCDCNSASPCTQPCMNAPACTQPAADATYLSWLCADVPHDNREHNEPFDAPGPYDPWLASTVPSLRDPNGVPGDGDEFPVWHRVSYLGRRFPNSLPDDSPPDQRFEDIPVHAPVSGPALPRNNNLDITNPVEPKVVLFDADGDGVPDSPISFEFPFPRSRPDDPKKLFAAIRIVDNASMLNVNTASSYWRDGAVGTTATFDESSADLQRRGRRAVEVLLDPACDVGDTSGTPQNNVSKLMAFRSGNDPIPYDDAIVRRKLLGGAYVGPDYSPFNATDEIQLRRRFSRTSYAGAIFPAAGMDSRLPYTLAPVSDWSRLSNSADWLRLVPESANPIRRSLFTTISLSCGRMPAVPSEVIENGNHQPTLTGMGDHKLVRGGVGITLPYVLPGELKAKINLNVPSAAQAAEYTAKLALAFFVNGQRNGFPSAKLLDTSWQLALNIIDYIDVDDEPSVLVDSSGQVKYVGQEVQPFINKYGARFKNDAAGDNDPAEERYAIEIINPYRTALPADFKILVCNGAATSTFPSVPGSHFPLIPGRTGSGLVRSVLLNDSTNVTLEAFASTFAAEPTFSFNKDDQIILVRTISDGSGPIDWPIDRVTVQELDKPDNGPLHAGESKTTVVRRDELNWHFTTARDDKDTPPGSGNLDLTGSASYCDNGPPPRHYCDDEVAPSQWVIRNGGFGARNFESPADISRLLVVGTQPGAICSAQPVTKFLYLNPPDNAAGRIDFGSSSSAAIFDAFTCNSLEVDGLDNDGDGATDEASEWSDVSYRLAGLININTAPADVLRCVPFMANFDALHPANNWDIGAAIVAYRATSGPFRSVSDLMRVNSVQRFGSDTDCNTNGVDDADELAQGTLHDSNSNGVPDECESCRCTQLQHHRPVGLNLVPHDPSGAPWSPDFDAQAGIDDAGTSDGAENDVRERDILLARWANVLSTRSDVFTVYIALIDENGKYRLRTQFTLDRSACAAEDSAVRKPVWPSVIGRTDTNYYDDTR